MRIKSLTIGILLFIPHIFTYSMDLVSINRRPRFNPRDGKIPWRREWPPTPVFLPGQRSLVSYSPQDGKGVRQDLGQNTATTVTVKRNNQGWWAPGPGNSKGPFPPLAWRARGRESHLQRSESFSSTGWEINTSKLLQILLITPIS